MSYTIVPSGAMLKRRCAHQFHANSWPNECQVSQPSVRPPSKAPARIVPPRGFSVTAGVALSDADGDALDGAALEGGALEGAALDGAALAGAALDGAALDGAA